MLFYVSQVQIEMYTQHKVEEIIEEAKKNNLNDKEEVIDPSIDGILISQLKKQILTSTKALDPDKGIMARGLIVAPWQTITGALLLAPETIPEGALVVVTTEKPTDFWYIKYLFALLGVFVLIFLWALVLAFLRYQANKN